MNRQGLQTHASGWAKRQAGAVLTTLALALAVVGTATADIYDPFDGSGPAGNGALSVTAGALTINTDTLTMSGAATATGEDDGGVAVFRFTSVNVGGLATVSVTGSRPLSIVSAGDMFWGVAIDASGAVAGRLGGGVGGTAGTGATVGGVGGAGGTGAGAGGAGGGLGRGAGRDGQPQFAGEAGGARGGSAAGANGSPGSAGSVGGSGGAGTLGFNGAGAGGAAGGGGAAGAASGTAANGGAAQNPGGGGGSGGAGAVDAAGSQGSIPTAGAAGNNGTTGNAGGNAGNGDPGGNGTFTVASNNLTLAAGSGGGGGGGGGKGGGGQGGGQGSGGSGGGGGGGGGGVDAVGNCGVSTDGLGGSGGAGGNGGTGGGGGAGGSASNGANGGAGANGGGAVVLATRGVLSYLGSVNISAGTPGTGGASAGQNAGGAGVMGDGPAMGGGVTATPTNGTWQFLQGIYCTGNGAASGGAGRAGAAGGTGGTGGTGGASGTSGAGGNGGNGTPGMVKLQGSVVLASGGSVTAANAASALAAANGKLTLISNLSNPIGQLPTLVNPATVTGTTGNDPILTGANSFDADPNHPLIGELTGATSAATEGILQSDFWNKPEVDAVAPAQRLQLITLGPADTSAGFAGYDQIFLRNNSADTLTDVFIDAGAGPVLIPTSTPGTLAPGEIFTTTVTTGASVNIGAALTFTDPLDATVNVGNPATFSTTVTASNGTAVYQWQVSTGGPFSDLLGENGPTLTLPTTAASDDGNQYRVVVEDNTNGPTASVPATLTVNDVANITTQPQGAELYAVENYTLTVVVQGGSGVYNYTWFLDSGSGPVVAPFNSNSPSYTIPSATPSDEGVYTVFVEEVGGAGATFTSSPATVAVVPLVQIDQDPVGGHGNTGGSFTFTVVASGGKSPVAYQWFFDDGLNPPAPVGTDSPTLNIPLLALSDAGGYYVTVSDSDSSSATSGVATLTVTDLLAVALTAPTPTGIPGVQASSTNLQDVYENGSITLSVTVSGGEPPYTYNWELDAGAGFGPVSGTNGNPTYTDASMTFLDAGTYRCTVGDSSPDPDVSASIVVGVYAPVSIDADPQDTTANVTEVANFSVSASGGIPPLSYDWRLNTASLGAPDQDTLAYGPVVYPGDDGGQFDVVVSDAVGVGPDGQQTSGTATLTVTNNIGVNLGADLTAYTTDTAVISALVAGGNGNYDYAWTFNGDPVVNGGNVSGADSDTLTITGPTLAQGGTYALTVSDDSGVNDPDSDSLVLSVFERTTVGGPVDVSVFVGDNAVFSVDISSGGIAPFGYDWREGGLSLGAPDQSTLTIPGVTLGDDGRQFDVVVTESASSFSAGIPVTSVEATLNVREALTVTDPVPASVAAYTTDAPFQLEVTPANGYGPPYTYQWFIIVPLLGPVPAPGFNANPQAVSPAAIASVVGTGFFDVFVVVGDGVGQATSGTSTLEIAEPLEITDGLEDATTNKGTQYTWSITVNGGLTPVTYSWTVDDGSKAPQVIPGADGPSYTTPVLNDLGDFIYEVTVNDGGGSSVSSSATLTVVAGVPAAGLLGLSLLTVAGALGGAALLRRRRD